MILPLAKSPPSAAKLVMRREEGGELWLAKVREDGQRCCGCSRWSASFARHHEPTPIPEKMRPLSASSGGLQKRKAQEATGRMVFQAGGVTRFK